MSSDDEVQQAVDALAALISDEEAAASLTPAVQAALAYSLARGLALQRAREQGRCVECGAPLASEIEQLRAQCHYHYQEEKYRLDPRKRYEDEQYAEQVLAQTVEQTRREAGLDT